MNVGNIVHSGRLPDVVWCDAAYDAAMLDAMRFTRPGVFVTGTDTGVGKTVVSCAIAGALGSQRPGARVGVMKPFATGCRKERGGLVNDDAEALAHFSDCRLPLDVINPVRYREALAPAVAAQQRREPIPWSALEAAVGEIDGYSDAVVVEGAGGVMVPLDPDRPRATWLDTGCFGLPTVVVARAGLGTLNHTAMTVRVLRDAGIKVAGVVVNGYEPDEAAAMSDDPSRPGNPGWIEAMTGARVLALVPRVGASEARPAAGVLSVAVLESVMSVDWWGVVEA